MQELAFLQDMAIVMITSAAVTIVCHQFKLPVVLGYIIAGIIIGPHTPPYSLITDTTSIHTLSELGVIFLLFGIGLEFSLTKLLKIGAVSFIAATLEILLMLWIGFSLGRVFGWNFIDSLFLGAILSISSTTIIAKILIDTKKLHERFAQIILGILVIEDLLAILIIALLSGLAFTGEFNVNVAFTDLLKVSAFVAGVLFAGKFIIPRVLAYIHSFQSSEMMVIAVLGLCFGTSLLAAKLGFSVALGAFLIGAVIAETKQAKFIIRHFESLRDMFTAVFFVSVGMLLVPKTVIEFAGPIAVITIITILGKVFACSLATFIAGDKPPTALKVGLGLAQIGEFSFIIAKLGESSGVTSPFIFPIAVAVSSLTTVTTPFLMKYTDPIVHFSSRFVPEPLSLFGKLYLEWTRRIQSPRSLLESKSILYKNLKRYFPGIMLYFVCLIALSMLPSWLIKTFMISVSASLIITGIVALPFLFGFLSNFDKLLWQTFLANILQQKEDVYRKDAQESFHNMLRLMVVIVFGLLMLMISSFFVSPLTLNIASVVLIVLSVLILWESVRSVHEKIERTVWSFFDPEKTEKSLNKKAHDELVQVIQENYPWGVETQDFILPYQPCALNRAIKELDVRAKTGASIVAIYRDEETLVNPPPNIVLTPGDVLLLMGNREQLESALKYMNQKIKET